MSPKLWTPPKPEPQAKRSRLLIPRRAAKRLEAISNEAFLGALADGRETLIKALSEHDGKTETLLRDRLERMNSAEFRRYRKSVWNQVSHSSPRDRALRGGAPVTLFLSGRARRRFHRGSRKLVVMPRSGVVVGSFASTAAAERLGEELARVSERLAAGEPLRCAQCGDHADPEDRAFTVTDRGPVCENCRAGGGQPPAPGCAWVRGRAGDLPARAPSWSPRAAGHVAAACVDGRHVACTEPWCACGCHDLITVDDIAAGTRRLISDVAGRNSNF